MSLSPDAILALASCHGLALASPTLQLDESGLDFQVAIAQRWSNQAPKLRLTWSLGFPSSLGREAGGEGAKLWFSTWAWL